MRKIISILPFIFLLSCTTLHQTGKAHLSIPKSPLDIQLNFYNADDGQYMELTAYNRTLIPLHIDWNKSSLTNNETHMTYRLIPGYTRKIHSDMATIAPTPIGPHSYAHVFLVTSVNLIAGKITTFGKFFPDAPADSLNKWFSTYGLTMYLNILTPDSSFILTLPLKNVLFKDTELHDSTSNSTYNPSSVPPPGAKWEN